MPVLAPVPFVLDVWEPLPAFGAEPGDVLIIDQAQGDVVVRRRVRFDAAALAAALHTGDAALVREDRAAELETWLEQHAPRANRFGTARGSLRLVR